MAQLLLRPSAQGLTHGEALLGPLELADLMIHLTSEHGALALDDAGVGRAHTEPLLPRRACNERRS